MYMFKTIKKKIRKHTINSRVLSLILGFSIMTLFLVVSFVKADDLMEEAFRPAMSNESVIDLGNNKNTVGNEIFKEGTTVSFGDGDGELEWSDASPNITKRPPLLVRISKFLLRITIALSITMVLFHGIKYIVEASKWEKKSAETIKSLVFVAVGILIALLSLTLVNLLSSITLSSLW